MRSCVSSWTNSGGSQKPVVIAAPAEHDAGVEPFATGPAESKGVVEIAQDGLPADQGAIVLGELSNEHAVDGGEAGREFRAVQR
jgi:hypothetical protein